MVIQSHGTFLVDRRLQVSRVQARFPLWQRDAPGGKPLLKPGHVHKGTLLDGEMVVNSRPDGSQRRVFYVYDLMTLNGKNVVMRPWKARTGVCSRGSPGVKTLRPGPTRRRERPRRRATQRELSWRLFRQERKWPSERLAPRRSGSR